jgi:hypothetical protein
MSGESIVQHGSAQALELRRRGTSDEIPARMNEEAENISPEARRLKQAGCYDQAVAMYSRCLELDCYNHWYSFQRAETLYVSAKYIPQLCLTCIRLLNLLHLYFLRWRQLDLLH